MVPLLGNFHAEGVLFVFVQPHRLIAARILRHERTALQQLGLFCQAGFSREALDISKELLARYTCKRIGDSVEA
jgi:hypothetical protein